MRKYIAILVLLLAASVFTIWMQCSKINRMEGEVVRYMSNTDALLHDVSMYRTKDSASAAKVRTIEMMLSEYERYRTSDAELIKTLQTKNRDLEAVATSHTETSMRFSGNARDSIIYLPGDTIVETLRCVDISDPWFSLKGCMSGDGGFSGTFVNRDSILIAETVQYKRFLGFLWKTRKVKNREIDVVSRNPHTKIIGSEYIMIEK